MRAVQAGLAKMMDDVGAWHGLVWTAAEPQRRGLAWEMDMLRLKLRGISQTGVINGKI